MAAVLAVFSMGASAATKSVVVNVKCVTGKPVPVSLTMDEVREAIGVDFQMCIRDRSTFPGDVFLQEKIATYITGPFAIPFWESMKPKGFEYDFVHIPIPDFYSGKEVWTYSDPKNIGIFQTAKYPEAVSYTHLDVYKRQTR